VRLLIPVRIPKFAGTSCSRASPPPTGSEILQNVQARAPRIVLSHLRIVVDTGLHSAFAHASVHLIQSAEFESVACVYLWVAICGPAERDRWMQRRSVWREAAPRAGQPTVASQYIGDGAMI
jgi:hypothetical protein